MGIHVCVRAPSHFGKAILFLPSEKTSRVSSIFWQQCSNPTNQKTYQVQVPLERAKLLCSKVLRQHRRGEGIHIVNAKSQARLGPRDQDLIVFFCSRELGFTLKHFIESTSELLRNASFSGTRVCQKRRAIGSHGINSGGGHDVVVATAVDDQGTRLG